VTDFFEHPLLAHPLSWAEFDRLMAAMANRALERPVEAKVFTGNESPGHDPHAARAIKKARGR
jgi:hypothetical protein